MAGSYRHATTGGGQLRNWRTMSIATETGGDSFETIEEMYGMIWYLAGGDAARVEEARQNYLAGIDLSPGRQPERREDRRDDQDPGPWRGGRPIR
jgi:hypothetical protein